MKKICFLFICLLSISIFAQNSQVTDNKDINPNTGFPVIQNLPFAIFNEGFACTWINRTIIQNNRSNFNFKDFLVGANFTITSQNMMPLNSMLRVAAYYPLALSFNDVPQSTKSVLQGGVDLFTGIIWNLNMWDYIKFNLSPGFHFLYQYTDRFNYLDLGLGGYANIELPLAYHWTILINGLASIDYGNLGSNASIEPYDIVWQYQLEIGVKYSKKAPNKFNYIKQIITDTKTDSE